MVVWHLDRVAKWLAESRKLTGDLEANSVNLRPLRENIDTTSLEAKLIFHILSGCVTPDDLA